MCTRFDALTFWARINELLALRAIAFEALEGLPAVVAPTDGAAVILKSPEGGGVEVAPMRFGLIPHWYRGQIKDFKAATFNARFETAAEKPVFKGPFQYRHALIPTEGFYEWSGAKSARTKWRITRQDNEPLAMAGIWDETETPEGPLWSFALLTRPAGPDMSAIHDREPIILNPDQWTGWLNGRDTNLNRPTPLRLSAESGDLGPSPLAKEFPLSLF